MKILKVLLLLVITGFVSISTLHAEGVDKENRYKKIRADRVNMRELYSKLNLTPQQKELMREHRKEIRKHRQDRIQNRKKFRDRNLVDLSEFITKDGFDKKGFIDKKMINIKKRIEERATMTQKRMNIFTPEQRVHLVKLLKEQLELQK